jgi:hypothetical protein
MFVELRPRGCCYNSPIKSNNQISFFVACDVRRDDVIEKIPAIISLLAERPFLAAASPAYPTLRRTRRGLVVDDARVPLDANRLSIASSL